MGCAEFWRARQGAGHGGSGAAIAAPAGEPQAGCGQERCKGPRTPSTAHPAAKHRFHGQRLPSWCKKLDRHQLHDRRSDASPTHATMHGQAPFLVQLPPVVAKKRRHASLFCCLVGRASAGR